jgi:hypothetical protein
MMMTRKILFYIFTPFLFLQSTSALNFDLTLYSQKKALVTQIQYQEGLALRFSDKKNLALQKIKALEEEQRKNYPVFHKILGNLIHIALHPQEVALALEPDPQKMALGLQGLNAFQKQTLQLIQTYQNKIQAHKNNEAEAETNLKKAEASHLELCHHLYSLTKKTNALSSDLKKMAIQKKNLNDFILALQDYYAEGASLKALSHLGVSSSTALENLKNLSPQTQQWVLPLKGIMKIQGKKMYLEGYKQALVKMPLQGKILFVGVFQDQPCLIVDHFNDCLSVLWGLENPLCENGSYLLKEEPLGQVSKGILKLELFRQGYNIDPLPYFKESDSHAS